MNVTFAGAKLLLSALLILLCFRCPKATAQNMEMVNARIFQGRQDAVLSNLAKGNWEAVWTTLQLIRGNAGDSLACNADPTLRMLYGHASLIMSRNNDAVAQFFCTCDSTNSESLQKWDWWTQQQLKEIRTPVTIYLRADALARHGYYLESKILLDEAIALDGQAAFALNARGVVHWLLYEKTRIEEYRLNAVKDLARAHQVSDGFADALVNQGVIGFRESAAPEMYRTFFLEALKQDPTYTLAINGMAVSYGQEGVMNKFNDFLNRIPESPFYLINKGVVTLDAEGRVRGVNTSSFALDLNVGKGSVLGKFINVGLGFKYERGGVYTLLKKGENLVYNDDKTPRQIGTWFLLNYPKPQ